MSQGNSLLNNMVKVVSYIQVYVLHPILLSLLCDAMKGMGAAHKRALCAEL